MLPNTTSDAIVTESEEPLLELSSNHGGERRTQLDGWWNKVLDLEEAKNQLLFSLPMILTNMFYYLITLVSVMFAGHLGELELAGAALANSWNSVTGVAVMVNKVADHLAREAVRRGLDWRHMHEPTLECDQLLIADMEDYYVMTRTTILQSWGNEEEQRRRRRQMLPNATSDAAVTQSEEPLLELSSNHGGERRTQLYGWWNKVLDLEEAKNQLLFSLPMILTNMFYYLITLISVMFAGHLGELELAGATLANSWNCVTGVAVMVGLSGALETLCGQGFGAEEFQMLGIYLQSSCIISFIFSIIVSIIWIYTQYILVLLQQSHDISVTAALYMKFLIPALFAFGFLQNILRFLQTQSVVMPLVVLSVVPFLLHIFIVYALVHLTALGFKGAPLAASISLWISLILLALYVIYAKECKQTWKGFSVQSFHYIIADLKLALPSAAMICLEYWAFEIMVFLAGLLPDSEITTSLIAICTNTEIIAYMIAYGLSAAASTRVSNELGAGHPDRAKHAMGVTLKLSLLLSCCVVLALALGHNIWINLFSDSTAIKDEFASMTPLLAISILLDSIQGVLSGVARGCGWQHLAAYINLATFYLIGLPISCVLGFKTNLQAKGLWIGLICGLACQTATLFVLTKCAKWTKLDISGGKDKENSQVI